MRPKGLPPRLIHSASFKIEKVLTDNEPKARLRRSQNEPKAKFRRSHDGKASTFRFAANGERTPTGKHPFDQVCQANGIEHRLIRPRHPEPCGMVERFNGRISEVLATTRFHSGEQLEQTLQRYAAALYNQSIPQKALGHITPVEALKNWYAKRPDLFKKPVYNQEGPDS